MSARALIFNNILRRSQKGLIALKGQVPVRQSHAVAYRAPPPPHSKATKIGAVLVSGAMWWWVLWHLWHEHEHITGEFDYPNPAKWSNAELGIPRD